MEKVEFWIREIVRANKYAYFVFDADAERHRDFSITFEARISETGKDVHYMLMSYNDYKKWADWKDNPLEYERDEKGNIVRNEEGIPIRVRVPEPKTKKLVDERTSVLKDTVLIKEGNYYALVFDNTYSKITDKTLSLHVTEAWNTELPVKNLPVVDDLVPLLPEDVGICLAKANDCYISGHYSQTSVMFRKAVEFASRIKILQAGLDKKLLYDEKGNELSLTGKIKVLRTNNLVTQRTAADLDKIKWFGDVGAHGTMKITRRDLEDNIEPKIRNFLVGLNLKR